MTAQPVKAKPKHAMPETLRRDLAGYRLQVAQVEIAKHPEIALDLLAFQAASKLLDAQPIFDGAGRAVPPSPPQRGQQDGLHRRRPGAGSDRRNRFRPTGGSRNRKPPASRRSGRCPRRRGSKLLAYCVALTLQPKLAPADGDEATAYDVALALTEGSVAAYWRPGKDSFLGRITRDQLLAIGRDTLGEAWARSCASEKKAALVEQLRRAFSDPEKSGRTREQVEKLKTWLPAGMAFDAVPASETGQGQESQEGRVINPRAGGNARPTFRKESHHDTEAIPREFQHLEPGVR